MRNQAKQFEASEGSAVPNENVCELPRVEARAGETAERARPEQPLRPPAEPRALKPSGAEAPAAVAPSGVAKAKKRRGWLRPTLFILLPIALVAGGYWYVTGGQIMTIENAYVQADMVNVTNDVSGIVKEVDVRENQKVAVGDVLFRLDDQSFQFALARADAQLGQVRDDLEAQKANYRNMQDQIRQAQADVDFNNRQLQRQQTLAAQHVASQASYDQAMHDLQTAQARLGSANQQLAGIVANLNGNPNIKIEDHPRYKDAVAQRNEAARQLSHTIVRAPIAGIATNVPSLQPGQYLAAAAPAFSVVATDHVWVSANPKETELTYVRPGQNVTVTVDTYPGVEWRGTVESISPASGASFSLLPAQNTSGNWVKVVQRIPIRVRIDDTSGKPPLRVGMSVEAAIDTGHARGLPHFLTGLFGGREHTDNGQS